MANVEIKGIMLSVRDEIQRTGPIIRAKWFQAYKRKRINKVLLESMME